MNTSNITVIKATGEKETFSEEKLRRSIKRAGIPQKFQDKVVDHIKKTLYPNIPTNKIYQHIIEFLNYTYPYGQGRYSLKQAIMQLGPTGYPFEKFVAGLLKNQGYETETDIIIAGKCVSHEIDVVAKRAKECFMVECKFHNKPGFRTNVKIALYVKARFDDLQTQEFHQAWLFTNTKLTQNAIDYGECVGMRLSAWRYPKVGSLQDLIEKTGFQPLTCLVSLSKEQKSKLLSQNIVLCRDVATVEKGFLKSIGVSYKKEKELKEEIELVCSLPKSSA